MRIKIGAKLSQREEELRSLNAWGRGKGPRVRWLLKHYARRLAKIVAVKQEDK